MSEQYKPDILCCCGHSIMNHKPEVEEDVCAGPEFWPCDFCDCRTFAEDLSGEEAPDAD